MLDGGQIVNGLGKYIKKHLKGSGSINYGSNICTVNIALLYTVKPDEDTSDEMGTLTVQICIKTYDNRIVVSISKGDLNINQKSYPVASFDDYEAECIKILNYSKERISKKFPQYDFKFC